MEAIVDATLNFWDIYPAFKSLLPFKKLYEGNDRGDSSTLMWFLLYVYHLNSPIYGMSLEDKIEMAGESLFSSKNYYKDNKKDIDYYADCYRKVIDSAADRQLRVWDTMMDEKTALLESLTYDTGTWEMIEKMLKGNKDLYEIERKIRADRERERGNVKKGGGVTSETDQGTI